MEEFTYRPADPIYEARHSGWLEGYHSRDDEIAKLNWTCSRYYTEMCRRPGVPFIDPNRPTYADLERIRGNTAHADQIDAQNAVRFSEVAR